MTSVIYPGTFDPDYQRAFRYYCAKCGHFPKVLSRLRIARVKSHCSHWKNALNSCVNRSRICPMWKYLDSLIYWRMKLKPKITAIIRGVRTTTDFEYELQLAALNRLLTDGVDSLFFPPTEKWAFVSSTIVREIYLHHGDVKELVPEAVYLALKARRE